MGRRRERSRKSDVSCEPSATATSTLETSLLAGPSYSVRARGSGTSYGQAQIDSRPSTIRSPPYQPGSEHRTATQDIRLRLPCKKLALRYIGPFVIQKQINPVTFQLKLPLQYGFIPPLHVSFSNLIHLMSLHPQSLARSRNTPSPTDSGG